MKFNFSKIFFIMQNLKYIIYNETYGHKLRSKFYSESIFLTYPGWADPQHRHSGRHYPK